MNETLLTYLVALVVIILIPVAIVATTWMFLFIRNVRRHVIFTRKHWLALAILILIIFFTGFIFDGPGWIFTFLGILEGLALYKLITTERTQ